jgi:hypothetical protein
MFPLALLMWMWLAFACCWIEANDEEPEIRRTGDRDDEKEDEKEEEKEDEKEDGKEDEVTPVEK